MSNKPKVSVIGVGRLGLSFALLLDSKGYDVVGCDVNEKYIESLKNKTFVSKEPGINELLQNSTMPFTTNTASALNHADITGCEPMARGFLCPISRYCGGDAIGDSDMDVWLARCLSSESGTGTMEMAL